MSLLNAFLIGFIIGGIIVGVIIEKTRRPTVIENSIRKIKDSDGSVFDQNMQIETIKPKRKKFLGIFKRKEK